MTQYLYPVIVPNARVARSLLKSQNSSWIRPYSQGAQIDAKMGHIRGEQHLPRQSAVLDNGGGGPSPQTRPVTPVQSWSSADPPINFTIQAKELNLCLGGQ
jgi:hypothetical protein